MTDTTMTDKERREKFLDAFLLIILRRIDEGEYHEVDHAVGDAQCLARYFRTLQSRLDQAHWDAISRDQTIETLREENERLRDVVVQLRDSIAGCREDVLDLPHLLRLWDLTADVLGEGVE